MSDSKPATANPISSAEPPAGPPGETGPQPVAVPLAKEIGGAPGPEPTRYGDWQHKGRVTDF